MVQAFPQPLDAFTRGFQGSFLPIYQLATRAKGKAEEQKLLADKREFDKNMKIAEIGIGALKLPNPRVRRQALGILAGKLSGGDKALANHIVTSITNLSDEEQAVMAKDLSDWRTSVLGGHKPSPELQASIDLYSRAFMSGEKSIDDLMKASEHLSKRVGQEEAAGLFKSPGSGAETAQPSPGAAPVAAPEAPVMAGPGTEPGDIGSTALAQEILARGRAGTPPSQAAVTPPSAGSPPPGGIDWATAPIETLRRIQARALALRTTQGAAAADRIGKFIDSRMKAEDQSRPKVGRFRGFGRGGVVDTITGKIVRKPDEGTSEPLVEVHDPDSPTGSRFLPRSQAAGMPGKPSRTEKSLERIREEEKIKADARRKSPAVLAEETLAKERAKIQAQMETAEELATRRARGTKAGGAKVPEEIAAEETARTKARLEAQMGYVERLESLRAQGREKPLSRIRQEAFERAKGAIEAREGLPQSPLGKALMDLERARKNNDAKATSLHEKAIEKMVSSGSFRDRLVQSITSARDGRLEDVHPDLRGFSLTELQAMNIDPIRAMMATMDERAREAGQMGPTVQSMLKAKNDRRIQVFMQRLPGVADEDLRKALLDDRLKGFTDEQKKRVRKIVTDELKRRQAAEAEVE